MPELCHPRTGLPTYLSGFRIYPVRESQGLDREHHDHAFWELHYCEMGEGFFQVRSKNFPLKPGLITLIYGPVPHRLYCPTDSIYRRTVIHFPIGLPLVSLDHGFEELLPIIPTKNKPCLQFRVPPEQRDRFSRLLIQGYDQCNRWEPKTRMKISQTLSEILLILKHAPPYVSNFSTEDVSPYEQLLVSHVENLIKNGVRETPALTTLSQQLQVSPGHIRRVFAKVRRRSLREYLIASKLSPAIACLRAGGSVTEAAMSGFYSNAGNFSRTFKNYMGISPSVFRSWTSNS